MGIHINLLLITINNNVWLKTISPTDPEALTDRKQ